MKVRAVTNRALDLPPEFLDEAAGYGKAKVFHVTEGKQYTVYALTTRRGLVWYYICDDRGLNYPVWHPAALFQIEDGRPSRYWRFTHGAHKRDGDVVFAFPEWAADPGAFYDRLSDGERIAVDLFRTYRTVMDREADEAVGP